MPFRPDLRAVVAQAEHGRLLDAVGCPDGS